jgi:hypothetical protein
MVPGSVQPEVPVTAMTLVNGGATKQRTRR